MKASGRILAGLLLAFSAVTTVGALPCLERFENEIESCYWQYQGNIVLRQLCYAEAWARYIGCLRDAADGD